MSYNANYSDSSKPPLIVDDFSTNSQTSLDLVGRKYTRYGEAISENFLHLLENFADNQAPKNPTEGQLWYDNSNNVMKYYTKNNKWQAFANIFTTNTQPLTTDSKVGDIWIKPSTGKLHFYVNGTWTEIGNTTNTTIIVNDTVDPTPNPTTTSAVVINGIVAKTRKDTQGNSHQTVELIVNSKTVTIFSSDDASWIPASVGANAEYLEGSSTSLLVNQFPTIKKGININPSGSVKYSLHNYIITELPAVKIDVGRGDVFIENNQYDNANGAGITIRTSSNPTEGNIFSVRSNGNVSRLWVGQSITSSPFNDFCVGFNGAIGDEYQDNYDIKLTKDGKIFAKEAWGEWVASSDDAIAGTSSTKFITPAAAKKLLMEYSFVPAGAIMAFAMNEAPTGWLKCDGKVYSTNAYPDLFAAIGRIYGGTVTGSTFAVPDFRGVFLRGHDAGKGIDDNRTFGGFQNDQFKSHTHRIIDNSNTDDGGDKINSFDTNNQTTQTGDAYVETTATGGSETRPKNYAILYCIKI